MSYASGPAPYGGQVPYGAPNQFGFGAPSLTPDIARYLVGGPWW